MASVVWSVIEGDRDLIRIMLREYEADRFLDAWVEHAVRSLEAGSAR
ncbi:hypothetical protein [Nonomuraea dietziae]